MFLKFKETMTTEQLGNLNYQVDKMLLVCILAKMNIHKSFHNIITDHVYLTMSGMYDIISKFTRGPIHEANIQQFLS